MTEENLILDAARKVRDIQEAFDSLVEVDFNMVLSQNILSALYWNAITNYIINKGEKNNG